MNIIAIGGGSVGAGETESIDRELIRLAGKENPRALFLPTATQDDPGYIQEFSAAYTRYGCQVDSLRLNEGEDPGQNPGCRPHLRGRGNTKMMVALWRERGVDRLLQAHLAAGKPAGGLARAPYAGSGWAIAIGRNMRASLA